MEAQSLIEAGDSAIGDSVTSGTAQGEHRPQPNCRGFKNGRRVTRLGNLPKQLRYVTVYCGALRKAILDALQTSGRDVSIRDECLVQTTLRHEQHAQLMQRLLRTEWDTMAITDRVAVSAAIGKASDARDKCITLLELDKSKVESAIDAYFSATEVTPEQR